MAKCATCGRFGFFLKLDKDKNCEICATLKRQEEQREFDEYNERLHEMVLENRARRQRESERNPQPKKTTWEETPTSSSFNSYGSTSGFTVTTSLTSHTVEIFQKTPGFLPPMPVSAWGGYESPSGGFVSYAKFKVTGVNPKTKRKGSRVIHARTEEAAIAAAKELGFVEPFETKVIPMDEPSDRQLDYAADLAALIPAGACSHDASAILSRVEDDDEGKVDESLAKAAFDSGMEISLYTGRKAIFEIAQRLPPEKKAIFYSEIR